jgi:hypothetical protein
MPASRSRSPGTLSTDAVPRAHRRRAYGWLALCFAGNAGLEVVDYWRRDPAWRDRWPLLVGSAPNVLAVAAIAGTLAGLALLSPTATLARWSERGRERASIAFSVTGLLLWEAVQPLTRRGVFDWHDVVATLVAGAALVAVSR